VFVCPKRGGEPNQLVALTSDTIIHEHVFGTGKEGQHQQTRRRQSKGFGARMQRFPMHITGPICSPTCHISYVLVQCALHRKVQSTAYGGGIFLIHPTSIFHQLGYGFDWTTTICKEWTHMDCHLGGPYIQNDCGSSSQKGTNVLRSVGAHDISGDLLRVWIAFTSHY